MSAPTLHDAAIAGDLDRVRIILSSGVHPDTASESGTPVLQAVLKHECMQATYM